MFLMFIYVYLFLYAIIRVRGIRTDYDIPGRDAEGPGWGRRVVGVTGLSALPGGLLDKNL